MTAATLIKLIEAVGWEEVRQRGSHRVFKHTDLPDLIVVPDHGKKDIGPGLLNSILKTAGLK